ncbi:MAG: NADH-quinone oxidoreductase subunit NuoG [Acidimicrobiia bacterium]|nr:NADH-quinone oxidoreductase subunit NuoG [Acidimicrobiia bacterium]
MSDPIKLTVDGREVTAPGGQLLIKAAEEHGTYIPRFCWHPRMKPVGMCRMCLVEVEGPRGKVLVTSCTTPVAEGMVVHTKSDVVKKAQEGVLEFLLVNHPLDCPVCDKGGECPLQDQTLSHGPGESRFVEEKRHFEKPIAISELVMLDRERCILCARCTRFSDEISGDPLIEFIDRGNHTQINTFPDEPFASYFSGNTVQICPVGALTATPYRFRARPWDLEAVESTCPQCSVGCRVSVQASQNQVLRLIGVDVDATNQGWLCDKGRFAFEHLRAPARLSTPLVRGADGELHEAGWGEALDLIASRIGAVIAERGPAAVAGLGGARSTNEEAYAFGKLLRGVLGTGNLDASLGDDPGAALLAGVPHRATIDDLERAKTILVWGPDLKEELPVLHLRVRRAATALGADVVVVHPRATGLDRDAAHVVRYRPGEGAATLQRLAAGEGDLAAVRAALDTGPVVAIVGRTGLAESADLADAVAAFALTLADAKVMPVARRGNVLGAIDMGVHPHLLPGRVAASDAAARAALAAAWGCAVAVPGRDTSGILSGMADGSIAAVLLLGCDPVADHPDRKAAAAAFDKAPFLVSLDLFLNESNRTADVVLPVDTFTEVEGTMTNLEGRVQKSNRIVPGVGASRPVVEILEDLAARLGGSIGAGAAAIAKEIALVAPAYAAVSWEALDWGRGRDGIVVAEGPFTHTPERRATDPSVGALTLHLGRVLYDGGTMITAGPSLARLAPEPAAHLHPDDASRLGFAAGDRVTVTGNAGSAAMAVAIDPTLARGTVYLPFNLGASIGNGLEVKVEK